MGRRRPGLGRAAGPGPRRRRRRSGIQGGEGRGEEWIFKKLFLIKRYNERHLDGISDWLHRGEDLPVVLPLRLGKSPTDVSKSVSQSPSFFLTPKILRPWLWVLRAWYPGLPATVATMWAREILTTCSLLPYVVAGIRWKGH